MLCKEALSEQWSLSAQPGELVKSLVLAPFFRSNEIADDRSKVMIGQLDTRLLDCTLRVCV